VGAIVQDDCFFGLCLDDGVDTLITRGRDFSIFHELATSNPFVE